MLPQRKKAGVLECFYVQSSLYSVRWLALGAETDIFQLAGEWVSLCCIGTEVITLRLLRAPIHCSGYLHAHQKCWISQSCVISTGGCIAEAFRHLRIKFDPVCDDFHSQTFACCFFCAEDNPNLWHCYTLFAFSFLQEIVNSNSFFYHSFPAVIMAYLIKIFRGW